MSDTRRDQPSDPALNQENMPDEFKPIHHPYHYSGADLEKMHAHPTDTVRVADAPGHKASPHDVAQAEARSSAGHQDPQLLTGASTGTDKGAGQSA
ncbi:hypothetical protein AMAG_18748 [Allomyces macrogynus ATCC 38327]|uniref:Uncharacterized protein n=1 Tax=Allomyces macrogynus (strain ATCC 38327) TaxID=578462 RepID=A0A0L0SFJ9_ALLM3|nr:hypothetical protein AMAG_18748 [Allomyces macrogynus ATCC 38327]|eukprot:KNE61145.1 hypothetical protein AMAG_18748 [Allomyces macrogynus ATCC 38327]